MLYCPKQTRFSEKAIIKRFYVPLYLAHFFNEILDQTAILDIKFKLINFYFYL